MFLATLCSEKLKDNVHVRVVQGLYEWKHVGVTVWSTSTEHKFLLETTDVKTISRMIANNLCYAHSDSNQHKSLSDSMFSSGAANLGFNLNCMDTCLPSAQVV